MSDNPYAPPVDVESPPPVSGVEPGGLDLSDHGWQIVASMAKWMRFLSAIQYVGAGLILIGALVLLFKGRLAFSSLPGVDRVGLSASTLAAALVVAMVLLSAMLFLAGRWLRRAASHFYDGVLANNEAPLAHGFANLRLYLILYGIFGVLGLLGELAKLAIKG